VRASYVTDPGTFEEIEQSPYVVEPARPVVAGFEATLREVLEQAAGTGADGRPRPRGAVAGVLPGYCHRKLTPLDRTGTGKTLPRPG
jgi:hypothetical protein